MTVEQLLQGTMVETQEMIDKRLEKVYMIEDIHKLEYLLEKKKTDFFHLYDQAIGNLSAYWAHLACIQMRRMHLA